MWSKIGNALNTLKDRLTRPLHIEFNLTDFCNLNCKGCSHYSPLAPKDFEPLDSLENSMKAISSAKNSRKIEEVFLIGGETLLYPHLEEAMRMARKYFPWCRLRIFTNGLLLPKMPDSFWETCKETGSEISITRYPVKIDYEKIIDVCRQKGVKFDIFGDRSLEHSFFKFPLDPDKKQNRMVSHFRCPSFGCVTVERGKIFPCSQAACIKHLNSRCGTDFRIEEGDYIPVEKLKDVKSILKLRLTPVPFCRYCKKPVFTDYGPSRRTADEWI